MKDDKNDDVDESSRYIFNLGIDSASRIAEIAVKSAFDLGMDQEDIAESVKNQILRLKY